MDVDRDDVGARGGGDHDGGQAHAAAAVHGDPLAGTDPALIDDRAKGRGEAAPEARRRGEVHRVGQRDEVQVGGVDRDVLGERAPVLSFALWRDPRPFLSRSVPMTI